MKKLVILGGGTAGCMAAASLSRYLRPVNYEITVLESTHINSIGVGESVLPSFISFLRQFGLSERQVIQKTGASIKLGTWFKDWDGNDGSFFHQLGSIGGRLKVHEFFDCWLKARSGGDPTPLQDYAPAAVMAREQRFDLPTTLLPDSPLAGANHALHLDAGLVSRLLREFARQRKVRFIKAHVVRVNLSESGCIESLELSSRETVEGDLFIDCSGKRGLLINEALNSSFESWMHYLPCDRAVVAQSPTRGLIPLYTANTARESGWAWRIPLQERLSNGYVFSSAHSSDHKALTALLGSVEGKPLLEPQFIPFLTGIRNQLWKKNCIAIGLAGGFLEPLASTAIHLAVRGVESLLDLFPNLNGDNREWPVLAVEYNRRMRAEYEEIRDFIILHYHTSKRTDSEFWRSCQSMPVPDSIAARIELFEARAELNVTDRSLFKKSSWQAVFVGMGVIPRAWHPFVDMADFDAIHKAMQLDRTHLHTTIERLPDYGAFLNRVLSVADE